MLIIKNMDMPKNCNYCRFNYDGLCHAARKSFRGSHAYIGGRLEDCPLEPFSWLYENDRNEMAQNNLELEANILLRKMMGIEPKEG